MDMEERLKAVENRLSFLEQATGYTGYAEGLEELSERIIKMDLTLPEADIDGLHFNETKVPAVFEKKDDGWYHSRDILFLSARNAEDDNSRDILTKYLNSKVFVDMLDFALSEQVDVLCIPFTEDVGKVRVQVSLPQKNEGVKNYNGVECWYWLKGKYAASSANFAYVGYFGEEGYFCASGVGGCAPVFRVAAQRNG